MPTHTKTRYYAALQLLDTQRDPVLSGRAGSRLSRPSLTLSGPAHLELSSSRQGPAGWVIRKALGQQTAGRRPAIDRREPTTTLTAHGRRATAARAVRWVRGPNRGPDQRATGSTDASGPCPAELARCDHRARGRRPPRSPLGSHRAAARVPTGTGPVDMEEAGHLRHRHCPSEAGLAVDRDIGYRRIRSSGPMGSTPGSPGTQLRRRKPSIVMRGRIPIASVAADPI